MKKRFTKFLAALALLAFFIPSLTAVGQSKAEVVYSTCRFGANYNPINSSYTSTFTATNGDFSWTIANGNNNNNGWTNNNGYGQVKFGRKNNASVGSITTDAAYTEAVTKVDLTIDAITAGNISSIKLYTKSANTEWTEAGSFDKAIGTQTVTLSNSSENLYYKIEFDCTAGSSNGLITISKVDYYYDNTAGGTLLDNDLVLEGAPIHLTFDLYGQYYSQIIYYDTNSEGEITFSENEYVTIAPIPDKYHVFEVTPGSEVTPSVQTITVYQASDGIYAAGSVTFTFEINDSSPCVGGDYAFTAGINNGTNSSGAGTITNRCLTFSCTNCMLNDAAAYRLYSGSTTTITTDFTEWLGMTQIVFEMADGYDASLISLSETSTGSYVGSGNTGTWRGTAESVSFKASAQVRVTRIRIALPSAPSDPYVTANDINLNYDATSGTINYVVHNVVEDGSGSVSVEVTEGNNWLSIATKDNQEGSVTVSCWPNYDKQARTATVTVTYNYYEYKSVSRDVTVTQAGNPFFIDEIIDIDATDVFYAVMGTIVAKSTRGFILGDGTGYIYYYNSDYAQENYNVGDIEKISGNMNSYNSVFQFTNSATIEENGTSYYNNTPTVSVVDASDIAAYSENTHLSDYVQFTGQLVKSGNYYNIQVSDLESDATISYPTAAQTAQLDELLNKTVIVKGYFAGVSSGHFSVIMESVVEDIIPTITVDPETVNEDHEGHIGAMEITYRNITISSVNDFGVQFYDAQEEETLAPEWIDVEVTESAAGDSYLVAYNMEYNSGSARTVYCKVFTEVNDNIVYSNLVTISQSAYVSPATYYYSVNGVIGEAQTCAVGHTKTLETGADLNSSFTFAGWTTDPSDVSERLTEYTFQDNTPVTFYAVYAHPSASANLSKDTYTYIYNKITDISDLTEGVYLIVYELTDNGTGYGLALDGSSYQIDNPHNNIEVEINDYTIEATSEINSRAFLISAKTGGYSLRTTTWLYMGVYEYANGLRLYSENDFTNQITFDNEGALISIAFNEGSVYLRYNGDSNQDRFRYYTDKSSINTHVQLYKQCLVVTPVDYYVRVFNETATSDIIIQGPAIIPTGSILDMGEYNLDYANAPYIVIEENGQLIFLNDDIKVEVHKAINKPEGTWGQTDNTGWYALSSPVGGDKIGGITNFAEASYDFFKYAEDFGWYNKEDVDYLDWIDEGEGFLYAREESAVLHFRGETIIDEVELTGLSLHNNMTNPGLHFIGNPYTFNIYKGVAITGDLNTGYYTLNEAGAWISTPDATAITPMQGVLVFVSQNDANITITPTPAAPSTKANNDYIQFTVANNEYEDVAYAWFDKGEGLRKIDHRNSEIPMVYIPQGDINYSIATMNDNTQAFNLNFKAMTTGQYTLSYMTQGEFNYMHIYDRLTGADVDMLLEGEYSFIGSPSDNDARFIVRLGYMPNNDSNDSFVYQNGNDVIVNGVGELQIFDVTGRMVMKTMVEGVQTVNMPSNGVYVFRMIGENVKTQKIVVR